MNKSILLTQLDYISWDHGLASGTWRLSFFLGLVAIVIYLLSKVDLDPWAKVLLGYALIQDIFVVEFPLSLYGMETAAFQATAGMNFMEVLLIPIFAITYPAHKFISWIKWVMLAEIICAWMGWRGLMIATSFNCALVALYLPFAPFWLWVIAVPVILTRHAGAAQIMLCTYLLLHAYSTMRLRYFISALAVIIPAGLGIVYAHSNGPMLDGLGRLDRWFGRYQLFWIYGDASGATHFPNWKQILFGVGPATFTWVSMEIDKFRDPVVIFMHNEAMQIPWELGLVGLFLSIAVYLRAYWRSKGPVRYALTALVPFILIWHPLRFMPSAILVAFVFQMALRGEVPWRKYGST